MAGFRRWYKRRYPTRYRRYRRFYRRSYARKYANGSSRSQIRLKVPITYNGTLTQAANTQGTTIQAVTPWKTTAVKAIDSQLYRNYCNLYEEVKSIGMKINVSVASQVGGSDIPSLQILTSFDRRWSSQEAAPSYAEMKVYSTYSVANAVNNSIATASSQNFI